MENFWPAAASFVAGFLLMLILPVAYCMMPNWLTTGNRLLYGMMAVICFGLAMAFLLVWWAVWLGMTLPIFLFLLLKNDKDEIRDDE